MGNRKGEVIVKRGQKLDIRFTDTTSILNAACNIMIEEGGEVSSIVEISDTYSSTNFAIDNSASKSGH